MTQVATRPGRISAQEDFLPTQLEHLHIAQFKGLSSKQKILFNVMLQRTFVYLTLKFFQLVHLFWVPCSRRYQGSRADSSVSAPLLPL